MNNHKIAILGGTGKSGKYLVKKLISENYHVKLLVRAHHDRSELPSTAEIVYGDARNYATVLSWVADCSVVISTLGQPKGESPIFSQATENIIKAIQASGISRYIVTTGLNVNTPYDDKSPKVKAATEWMYEHYGETTRDKQKEYELLSSSNIDWTLVRLPLIMQTDERYTTETSLTNCEGDKISANDLVEFLITQIDDSAFIKKSPFIYNI
ncbi:NAD(P)H-binding protein [Fulvivirga maritima]|uniref:NAD(P)-dependent oxidoreductase n=1 Tax=Fulvivirga maritima TaxID=2904247 RepID=UPI001F466602|nr:NAD(P)H-binding protein [Fulvivirga maritima]UII26145.1 NAD(P)H-binding protein [Fulvivirga maritima]